MPGPVGGTQRAGRGAAGAVRWGLARLCRKACKGRRSPGLTGSSLQAELNFSFLKVRGCAGEAERDKGAGAGWLPRKAGLALSPPGRTRCRALYPSSASPAPQRSVTGRQGQLHNVKDPVPRSLNRGSLAWWQQASPAKFQHIGKLDVKKHETLFYLDSGCQYKFFYMK